MYQTVLATTAVLLTACAAPPSSANCDNAGRSPCGAELADVAIFDRTTGKRLTIYSHDGQRWVAGTPGHRYAVSIQSKWSGRILSVVSVDGVNVVSAETAAWGQSGYVLSPAESFDILGWRKSQDRVADFFFTDLGDSYAARTGRPDDIGVIGVAVFRETTPVPPISRQEERSDRARAAPEVPSASGQVLGKAAQEAPPASRQALGTGHGQSEFSQVTSTNFERAQDHPDQVIAIRYDRRERLVAMGVIRDGRAPRPFPDSASTGFVPDPPTRW